MAISLTIDGKEAALKKGSSIEYVCKIGLRLGIVQASLVSSLTLHSFSQEVIIVVTPAADV